MPFSRFSFAGAPRKDMLYRRLEETGSPTLSLPSVMTLITMPPPYETYEQRSDGWVKSSEYYLDEGNLILLVRPDRIVIDGNLCSSTNRFRTLCTGCGVPVSVDTRNISNALYKLINIPGPGM